MASTSLPHFRKSHLLGKLLLLGVKVPLWTADADAPLNSPCLYEFALYGEKMQLAGVYIGKARRSIGRPIEQYDEFIRSLRQNRLHGLKPGDHTQWPFKPKRPWSFRWIHHELERTLYAIASGRKQAVELCVLPLPFDSSRVSINTTEAKYVDAWKRAEPDTCINGGPSIANADRDVLDPAWRK